MLSLALISASPLVRGGLDAGLRQFGGFDIRLHCDGLQQARQRGFAQAQVAVVELAPDHDTAFDVAGDGPPLVLLVARQHLLLLSEWLREGCSLLPCDAPIAMIAAAAHAAAAGLVSCTPHLAADVWSLSARAEAGASSAAAVPEFEPLTPRENEVLVQMSFGLGNREIAETLQISTHTAKFHVAQIIAKLDASSRAHAVAKALRAGLVAA